MHKRNEDFIPPPTPVKREKESIFSLVSCTFAYLCNAVASYIGEDNKSKSRIT